MVYPYMTFNDGTEIVHTHLLEGDHVEVNFERATENGFDSARCELPSYKWLYNTGYSAEEIEEFTIFVQRNAHLFYRFAAQGGAHIA